VNYSTAVGGELIVSTLFALPLILFPAVQKDLFEILFSVECRQPNILLDLIFRVEKIQLVLEKSIIFV
jgi:hypothetical protein